MGLVCLVAAWVGAAQAAPPPVAPAVVAWMQPAPPAEEVRAKVQRLTGGAASHVAWAELALEPRSASAGDLAAYTSLAQSLTDTAGRWTEFDAEAAIARALDANVQPIEVVRTDADRELLIRALLAEGAGITRPYPVSLFNSLQETAPFLAQIANRKVVKAWLDALALDPRRALVRAEFPDGQSFQVVKTLQEELLLLPRGKLAVDAVPAGFTAVIDGRAMATAEAEYELAPGHHYAHLVRDGAISNAVEFDLAPGGKAALSVRVSADELTAARARVLAGSTDLGPDVASGLRQLGERTKPAPRVFVAALDDTGKPVMLAYGGGAVITKVRPVTAMFTGDLGGGLLQSTSFAGAYGQEVVAPVGGGDLGFELGIYNAAIQVGGSMLLVPTAQFAYGIDGATTPAENEFTSALFNGHGGLGVYLPRPQAGKVYFLLAGTYGWLSPGALGFGAQLATGIPMKGDGKTWLRVSLAGMRGEQLPGFPEEGSPTSALLLRLGFASLL